MARRRILNSFASSSDTLNGSLDRANVNIPPPPAQSSVD
ncbi:hypothetical protein C7S17_4298 [Burkholderia thailandensis]|nr:hypothetical protein [Burkholderia thailandensis]